MPKNIEKRNTIIKKTDFITTIENGDWGSQEFWVREKMLVSSIKINGWQVTIEQPFQSIDSKKKQVLLDNDELWTFENIKGNYIATIKLTGKVES